MSIEDRIKLRQLLLVTAIQETGSIRRASEQLNITQPAATKALHDLEYHLGVPLFTRSKAGMTPTPFGAKLGEYAHTILNNVRSGAEAIAQMKLGDRGEVSIGTLPASALTIVPQALALLLERRPGIRIRLFEGSTGQLIPSLERGDLDILVGRLPSDKAYPGLDLEVLCNDPNVIVCRKGHLLDRADPVRPDELLAQKWMLPDEGSNVRADLRRYFESRGLPPPEPVLVTSSTAVRLNLLLATDMVAVLTKQAAMESSQRGLLAILNVGMIAPHAPIMVATRHASILTPAAEHVLQCIREAASLPAATTGISAQFMPDRSVRPLSAT